MENKRPFFCPAGPCQSDFENFERFYIHWLEIHEAKCPRPDCKRNALAFKKTTKDNFQRHWQTHHPLLQKSTSVCICGQRFTNRTNRDRHQIKCASTHGGADAELAVTRSSSSRVVEADRSEPSRSYRGDGHDPLGAAEDVQAQTLAATLLDTIVPQTYRQTLYDDTDENDLQTLGFLQTSVPQDDTALGQWQEARFEPNPSFQGLNPTAAVPPFNPNDFDDLWPMFDAEGAPDISSEITCALPVPISVSMTGLSLPMQSLELEGGRTQDAANTALVISHYSSYTGRALESDSDSFGGTMSEQIDAHAFQFTGHHDAIQPLSTVAIGTGQLLIGESNISIPEELQPIASATKKRTLSAGNFGPAAPKRSRAGSLNGEAQRVHDQRILDSILQSLQYEGMGARSQAIHDAGRGTLQWIFGDSATWLTDDPEFKRSAQYKRETRGEGKRLQTWLATEAEKIFAILGKPASGKSTLMKFLRDSDATTEALKTWAGDRTLIVADHFFWLPGPFLSSSLEGLCRSILHAALDVLSNDLATVKSLLLERRWTLARQKPWSIRELRQAISALGSLANTKVFLLIDGLDECVPQSHLDESLTEIMDFSQLPNFKICVSSRPWIEITPKLHPQSQLHLHTLSSPDMVRYAHQQLSAAEAGPDLRSDFRKRSSEAVGFIEAVVKTAEGVFYWLELVLRFLKTEILKGRQVADLYKILSEYPKDLDRYYHKMIFERLEKSNTNVSDTACALRLIQITCGSPESTFTQAWRRARGDRERDASFSLSWHLSRGHLLEENAWRKFNPRSYGYNDINKMIHETDLFLTQACKDLVVVRRPPDRDYLAFTKVQFTHRTVLDFLQGKNVLEMIDRCVPAHFIKDEFLRDLEVLDLASTLQYSNCRSMHSAFADLSEIVSKDARYSARHRAMLEKCSIVAIEQVEAQCDCLGYRFLLSQTPRSYKEVMLRRWPHLAFGPEGSTLLREILCSIDPAGPVSQADLDMVEYILLQGCDPNLEPFGQTLRHDALRQCLSRFKRHLDHHFTHISGDNRDDKNLTHLDQHVVRAILLLSEYEMSTTCRYCWIDLSSQTNIGTVSTKTVPIACQAWWNGETSERAIELHGRGMFRMRKLSAIRSMLVSLQQIYGGFVNSQQDFEFEVAIDALEFFVSRFVQSFFLHDLSLSPRLHDPYAEFWGSDITLCLDCQSAAVVLSTHTDHSTPDRSDHLRFRLKGNLPYHRLAQPMETMLEWWILNAPDDQRVGMTRDVVEEIQHFLTVL